MISAKLELKTNVCYFQLTQACKERKGIVDARLGYQTKVGKEDRFACGECTEEIIEHIAKDLERKIAAKGGRVA